MWQEVGAHAMGNNGNEAVQIVTKLMKEAQS
jgi:hypothetical protein